MTATEIDKELTTFRRLHRADANCVMLFSYRKVEVEMYRKGTIVYLAIIVVTDPDDRSKGHGTRTLKKICEWADKCGITLQVAVVPFDSCPLKRKQLRDWYKRFGFVGKSYHLTREPKTN